MSALDNLTGDDAFYTNPHVTLAARIGIIRFERYLAKQAAFAAYLKENGIS